MKKTKQEKKQTVSSAKDLQLPIIQSNIQKGNIKPSRSSLTKPKNEQKIMNMKSNLNDIPQIPNIPINKNIPKDIVKTFGSTNISQSTNKTRRTKSGRKKKIFYYKEEVNPNNELIKEEIPRISEEKLSQLKEQRKKRLKQAKIEEEKELKIYSQLIEEFKNNKKNKNFLLEENSKIQKISGEKAQKILEEGGMLDAYKYVLAQLCRHGLPNGNIFEYASYVVKNFEKKWKDKKSKMIKEKIDKYYEEKQKELNNTLETEGEIKKINKSLEHREEYKFIQHLDKSRSKRNIVPRISSPTFQDNFSSFSRNNLNKNFKILKDIKTSQGKEQINIHPLKLNQIGLEKDIGVIKNNFGGDMNLNKQYKNIIKRESISKLGEGEKINNNNIKNLTKTKKKK